MSVFTIEELHAAVLAKFPDAKTRLETEKGPYLEICLGPARIRLTPYTLGMVVSTSHIGASREEIDRTETFFDDIEDLGKHLHHDVDRHLNCLRRMGSDLLMCLNTTACDLLSAEGTIERVDKRKYVTLYFEGKPIEAFKMLRSDFNYPLKHAIETIHQWAREYGILHPATDKELYSYFVARVSKHREHPDLIKSDLMVGMFQQARPGMPDDEAWRLYETFMTRYYGPPDPSTTL